MNGEGKRIKVLGSEADGRFFSISGSVVPLFFSSLLLSSSRPTQTGSPKPFINLVHHHVGWDVPKTVLDWNPRKGSSVEGSSRPLRTSKLTFYRSTHSPTTAILRGDPFHMRYQWSTDLMWQCGRLMLGMNVSISLAFFRSLGKNGLERISDATRFFGLYGNSQSHFSCSGARQTSVWTPQI